MTALRRNLSALEGKEFDLVIIGGGIFGACAAWEASSRGLSVALIERGDFASATSANSFKMVHGGIRYLQHADLPRIRQSVAERNVLLRIAPHLVQPLPIVIPTYGHGIDGREALKTGLFLYDLLAFDRNRGIKDPERRIPPGALSPRVKLWSYFLLWRVRDFLGPPCSATPRCTTPAPRSFFLKICGGFGSRGGELSRGKSLSSVWRPHYWREGP